MGDSEKKKDADTIEIPLTTKNIKAHGEPISMLKLRRPKGRDFRKLRNPHEPVSMLLDFAAHLAGVPPSTVDELDADDVAKVIEAVSGFLGTFPVTGMM